MTDPRNISPRTEIFTLQLGRYIARFESYVKEVLWLVKGLDLVAREARLTELFKVRRRPGIFFEFDFSRFDAHVQLFTLKTEHEFYKWAFPDDNLLNALLELQLRTTGIHTMEIYYYHEAKRCSGDVNTSIGNGFINRLTFWWSFSERYFDYATSHEGDDTLGVIFCESIEEELVRELLNTHLSEVEYWFGMPMEAVVSPTVTGTTYCGRCHYMDGDELRSYCDIPRTAAKFHITTVEKKAGYTHEELMRSLLLAKCNSYLSTDADTPLIGPYCLWLKSELEKVNTVETVASSDMHRRLLSSGRADITSARREDVALRFGIPIASQLSFEASCIGPIREMRMPICQEVNVKEDNFVFFNPSSPVG